MYESIANISRLNTTYEIGNLLARFSSEWRDLRSKAKEIFRNFCDEFIEK